MHSIVSMMELMFLFEVSMIEKKMFDLLHLMRVLHVLLVLLDDL